MSPSEQFLFLEGINCILHDKRAKQMITQIDVANDHIVLQFSAEQNKCSICKVKE